MTADGGKLPPDGIAGELPCNQSRLMSHPPLYPRRSTMAQSRTLCIGMEVPTDARAVASVAQAHGAAGISLGTVGTRPSDMDHLGRQRPSKAKPLVCGYAAGPCGYGLSRSLTPKGSHCGVGAPSLMPPKAGARGHTARRDAGPLARLRRAGDLPPVSVPTVADAAIRELPRAREEAIGDLPSAHCRLQAFLRHHDIRSTGRAPGPPAHLRWLSEVVWPPPR